MKNWFYPENLMKLEKSYRLKQNNIDVNNDFGSYKVMLNDSDLKSSNISNHNDLYPYKKIKCIKKITDHFSKQPPKNILNLGCGLGFETKALQEIYNCQVTGVDISSDGIKYAKKNNFNSKISYYSKVVDKNFFLNDEFDICYAIEFYPFSRTDDFEFQKNLISAIFKNIKKNGFLIIYQLDIEKDSIKNNLERIAKTLKSESFIISDFHPKIFRIIPSIILTKLICILLSKIFNKMYGKTIICLVKNF